MSIPNNGRKRGGGVKKANMNAAMRETKVQKMEKLKSLRRLYSPETSSVEITVKQFCNKDVFRVKVPKKESTTVHDVKNAIEWTLGYPASAIRLVFPCHELKNEARLKDIPLKSDSVMYMLLRKDFIIKKARFVVMSVSGERCFLELPIAVKVKRIREAVASKLDINIEEFSIWMRDQTALSKNMEEKTIGEAFNITPQRQQQRDEFLVIRRRNDVPVTRSQLLRMFQHWSKGVDKAKMATATI